jgi:hypothetical protein
MKDYGIKMEKINLNITSKVTSPVSYELTDVDLTVPFVTSEGIGGTGVINVSQGNEDDTIL